MKPKKLLGTIITASLLAAANTSFAQGVWDGSANGNWANTANWVANAVPGANSLIRFNSSSTGSNAPYLSGARTVSGIEFLSGNPVVQNIKLSTAPNGGTAVNLTFNASNTGITVADGATHVIGNGHGSGSNGDIVLLANLPVATTSGNLTFNRPVTGATFGITKTGGGNLILSDANTYTGLTTITAGNLQIGGGLSTGSLAITGTIANNSTLIFNRNNALTQGTHFSTAAITGTGAITQAGAGTTTLNAQNSFSGAVAVNAGTLAAAVLGTGGNSALGSVSTSRTITINTGGTLRFDVGNVFSNNFASSSVPAVSVAGGTVTNGGSATNNALGAVTLTGGTLTATTGHADYGAFNLNGSVTSSGTSLISTSDATNGRIMLTSSGANNVDTASSFNVTDGTLTVSAPLAQVTVESKISGLAKSGAGAMILSGDNTYTGATTISGGSLLINGNSSTAVGAVTVSAGTFGGTGRTGGAVSVAAAATLAPGASIESLDVASLNMASTSVFAYEVASNSTTGADLLASRGALTLSGATLSLDPASLLALAGTTWTAGNKLTLISYLGADVTSGFTGYTDDTTVMFGANEWTFDYNDTVAGGNYGTDAIAGGQDRFVTLTALNVIPEPSAALLGGIGALILLRRRRA